MFAALTDDQIIEKYIALRDKKDAIKKQHTEQLKPYNEVMYAMEMALLDRLNQRGADSTKTKVGTAYISTDTSVTCHAWSQTFDFIQKHEHWELLEARVNKTAALEIMNETGKEIPGVAVRRDQKVNIRRS